MKVMFQAQKLRVVKVVLLSIFLMVIWSACGVAAEVKVPMPEDYIASGEIKKYLMEAIAFLKANNSSKFAPRVALDVMMTSDRMNQTKLSNMMKAYLLFEQSYSIQAVHVSSSFSNAKELREFLIEISDLRLKESSKGLARQFTQALEVGLKHFKMDILDDNEFLLRSYCLAEAAGAGKINEIIVPAIRKKSADDDKLAEVAGICLDKSLSVDQKVVKLHGKDKRALFVERFYISTLSEEQKKAPGVMRILIANAVGLRKYENALALIGTMSPQEQKSPQVLFWKGWSLGGLGKDQKAVEVLNGLVKGSDKDSKWAKVAQVYASGIGNRTDAQKDFAELILALSKSFQSGVGVFQANVKFDRNSDVTDRAVYSMYIGLVPEENRLELVFYKDEVVVVAYRSDNVKSAVYLKEDNKILAYKTSGPVPTPVFTFDRNEGGGFDIQAAMAMETSIKSAGAKSSNVFKSPYLSTAEGIKVMLDYMVSGKGLIPGKTATAGGVSSYVWHVPSVDSPDMKRLEYSVSAENVVSGIKFGNVSVEGLKYGPKDSFKLSPPAWPKCPVQESDKFDFAVMMKLMSSVMSIFSSK